MNPSVIIGAGVGGALFLITSIGVVWIIRRNRTTSLRKKKQISATTEIVIAQLENDSIQVKTWRVVFPLTEHLFSIISDVEKIPTLFFLIDGMLEAGLIQHKLCSLGELCCGRRS
jgi:hypothetical protein